jgi:hypothetical protein
MTAPAAAAAAGVDDAHSSFPSELLAFSLSDGRSGVLSFRCACVCVWAVDTLGDWVSAAALSLPGHHLHHTQILNTHSATRGRKVHDVNPKRPSSGVGPHSLGPVSAVAAVWPLMLLGDAEGCLMAWDLLHGRCTSLATGERALQ